jgi:hypothetical protein
MVKPVTVLCQFFYETYYWKIDHKQQRPEFYIRVVFETDSPVKYGIGSDRMNDSMLAIIFILSFTPVVCTRLPGIPMPIKYLTAQFGVFHPPMLMPAVVSIRQC